MLQRCRCDSTPLRRIHAHRRTRSSKPPLTQEWLRLHRGPIRVNACAAKNAKSVSSGFSKTATNAEIVFEVGTLIIPSAEVACRRTSSDSSVSKAISPSTASAAPGPISPNAYAASEIDCTSEKFIGFVIDGFVDVCRHISGDIDIAVHNKMANLCIV